MTKIHDMGGIPCVESLPLENTTVFEKKWHKIVLSLTLAVGALGKWNLDRSRYFRESLPPDDYGNFTYYEKWMAGLVNLMVDSGLIDQSELRDFKVASKSMQGISVSPEALKSMIAKGDPSLCNSNTCFEPHEIGTLVKTKSPPANNCLENGHTRLPAYSSGSKGEIVLYHGFHRLPDANAHLLGPNPEPLYTVSFTAYALWGNEAENPDDKIHLDLWHSYLEPIAVK
ncbi:MAG: nitrile hydratase subunit beta [Rhodobacteraceae bacterium]|nr:nitrile hydratase subunit beta [Paracoccaceae bacterium]